MRKFRLHDAAVAYPARRWAALAILITAGFMDLLDTTIVNVAIPEIRRNLDASYAAIQWIVAGAVGPTSANSG